MSLTGDQISNEALERRERSISRLKREGVPVMAQLPVIEDSTTALKRSTKEIANRAIATCIGAVKGEGIDQKRIDSIVKWFEADAFFSPLESAFIKDPNPSEETRIQFCWRYECLWVFLWALGYIETLERPDKICDVTRACTMLRELGPERFISEARVRPIGEILDEADLIYRYDWAVVDAQVRSKPTPGGVDPGVVLERHRALNWLIGYLGQEWDNVTTDT